MSNLRMILEELLPFYFLVMVFVIMFTGHTPTTFELYIVYAFSFGVALFNNRLYRENQDLQAISTESILMISLLKQENEKLKAIIDSKSGVDRGYGKMEAKEDGKETQ